MRTIYVSGRYTSPTRSHIGQNIAYAAHYSTMLWQHGYGVFCPHLNAAHIEEYGVPYEQFMQFDLWMVEKCDTMFMLPGWEISLGAKIEHQLAVKLQKPVFYTLLEATNWLNVNGG